MCSCTFKVNNINTRLNVLNGLKFNGKEHLLDVCIVNFEHIQFVNKIPSQLAFTCSKSTIETLEKGVKYAQG